jgi:hypothetical protein
MKKFRLLVGFVFAWLASAAWADDCVMCFLDGCMIVSHNGFKQCGQGNACSGNCFYKPPKPPGDCTPRSFDPTCSFSLRVNVGDNSSKKSCVEESPISAIVVPPETTLLKSAYTTDPLLAHALSKLNAHMSRWLPSATGAMGFALAKNESEMETVFREKSLPMTEPDSKYGYAVYKQSDASASQIVYHFDVFHAEKPALIYGGKQWLVTYAKDANNGWKLKSFYMTGAPVQMPMGFESTDGSTESFVMTSRKQKPALNPEVQPR